MGGGSFQKAAPTFGELEENTHQEYGFEDEYQDEDTCWIDGFPENYSIQQIISHEVVEEFDGQFGQKILLWCQFADANSNDLLDA